MYSPNVALQDSSFAVVGLFRNFSWGVNIIWHGRIIICTHNWWGLGRKGRDMALSNSLMITREEKRRPNFELDFVHLEVLNARFPCDRLLVRRVRPVKFVIVFRCMDRTMNPGSHLKERLRTTSIYISFSLCSCPALWNLPAFSFS
jgi:hypothetical protein